MRNVSGLKPADQFYSEELGSIKTALDFGSGGSFNKLSHR